MKQRRAATFNSVDSDEDDNSDSSDSNDDSHDDGDCRPFNTKIRAEIVRMAKSAKNLSDLEKLMGPGRAKQPYYRMTLAQKMQHRRLKQRMPAEDENDERYLSLSLTPHEMILRKQSSKKVLEDYLADWRAFLKEKKAACMLSTQRRVEIKRRKKQALAAEVKGKGKKEDLSLLLPPVHEVKTRLAEAQYVKDFHGWKVL